MLIYGHGDIVMAARRAMEPPLTPWAICRSKASAGTAAAPRTTRAERHRCRLARQRAHRTRRQAGLQCRTADRNRRGNRLAGLDAFCRGTGGSARRRGRAGTSDGPRLAARRPTVFSGSHSWSIPAPLKNLRESERALGRAGRPAAQDATTSWPTRWQISSTRARHRSHRRSASAADSRKRCTARSPMSASAAEQATPPINNDWGETSLTPPERGLLGSNSFEVLALKAAQFQNPVNAIPASAFAICQLRFIVGTDWLTSAAICAAVSINTVSRWSRSASSRARRPPSRSRRPWDGFGHCFARGATSEETAALPTSAARCPTRSSPTRWACRPSGAALVSSLLAERAERASASTSRAPKDCRSWPDFSVSARHAQQTQPRSTTGPSSSRPAPTSWSRSGRASQLPLVQRIKFQHSASCESFALHARDVPSTARAGSGRSGCA